MIVARIVRVFAVGTPAGGAVEQRLGKVLELPMPPARGQLVHVAAGGAHRIERVIVTAREAGSAWTPGWREASMLDVLLAPEPPAGLAAAFDGGWKGIGA